VSRAVSSRRLAFAWNAALSAENSERLEALANEYAGVELTSAQQQLTRRMVAWYSTNCVRHARRCGVPEMSNACEINRKNEPRTNASALRMFGGGIGSVMDGCIVIRGSHHQKSAIINAQRKQSPRTSRTEGRGCLIEAVRKRSCYSTSDGRFSVRHSSPLPCYFGQLYDAFRFRYARFNE
jgi:hypothetical protein